MQKAGYGFFIPPKNEFSIVRKVMRGCLVAIVRSDYSLDFQRLFLHAVLSGCHVFEPIRQTNVNARKASNVMGWSQPNNNAAVAIIKSSLLMPQPLIRFGQHRVGPRTHESGTDHEPE